ncbi:oxysterol-binding protein, PH domain-like protein [Artemisia annua]|uniref:Oxysterol-binding protein, PH domain-like protein n=1 Tax=Artemisia annua TaxID=35608 RepID=A0A2U1KBQ8_ARTAN|nr:oxysterol-binding protein, PH domain-like protein [Artemisia annua]
MHYPLCCISIESHHESPEACSSSNNNGGSSNRSFAGMLYKWTNYGKGWRSRWFLLRNGVLTYSKIILQPETLADVSFIGDVSSGTISSRHRKRRKSRLGIVHLKVSSFRESRSDDKRFYIFTATKTLHLRTSSNKERLAWIQALASSSSSTKNLNDTSFNVSLSTDGLRKRLVEGGVGEEVVKDCEQIMLLEFSQLQTQLHLLCQERSSLLDTLRQLEAANIEVEASGGPECEYPLTQQEYSDLRRGKYSGMLFMYLSWLVSVSV